MKRIILAVAAIGAAMAVAAPKKAATSCRAKTETRLAQLQAKMEKSPDDLKLKRAHAELVAATGDWEEALKEFAALGGDLARIAQLENPEVKPESNPAGYVPLAKRVSERDRKVEAALKKIVVPQFAINPPATIVDAIEHFRDASREQNINFVLRVANPPSEAFEDEEELMQLPQVPKMTADNIKLYDLIKRVCASVDHKFAIRNGVVIVMPKDMAPPEDFGNAIVADWKDSLEIAAFWRNYKCVAASASGAIKAHADEYYSHAQKKAASLAGGLIAGNEVTEAQLETIKVMDSIHIDSLHFKPPATVGDVVGYFNRLLSGRRGVKFVLRAEAKTPVKGMVAANDIKLLEAAHLVIEEGCGCKLAFEGENIVIKAHLED